MTKTLFFDTDCLSAFLWVDNVDILKELYGGYIVLPGPVYVELSNPCVPHLKTKTDHLIRSGDVSVKEIEIGTKEYGLYSELVRGTKNRKSIGRGEASAIALAKVYGGILASNNYKDISPYIEEYGLRHTDTASILTEALDKGIITEEQGNRIWKEMLLKRRKLPTNTFSEYLAEKK